MRKFSYNEERKEKHKILLNQGFLKKNGENRNAWNPQKMGRGNANTMGKVKNISRLFRAPEI